MTWQHEQDGRGQQRFQAGAWRSVWVVALLWLAGTTVRGQFNVSLEPQLSEVQLTPGKKAVLTFRLTNEDQNTPALVRVAANDIRQGPRGEYMLADSLMPYSCVPWLTLPDTLVEIGPGETREIPVTVKVPLDAHGGAYGAVVFEILQKRSAAVDPTAMVLGAQYRFQLPAWIEITIQSARAARGRLTPTAVIVVPTADVPEMLKEYGDRGMVVTARVKNTGDIHVFTKGRLIIRDENQRLIRDTRLGSGRGAILPGATTSLQTVTKLPPPGKYIAKAIVDYGGRSPAIAQTSFEITSGQAARTGKSDIALPLYVDLRPEKFEPSIPSGGFRVMGLSLLNREQEQVTVDIGLGWISFDENGQMWVSDEQVDSGRTCAPWLTIEPSNFVLDPDRRKNVQITLKVPDGVGGGYYSCLVVNTRLASDTGSSTLPSPIYCPIFLTVPPDLKFGGEIVNVGVEHPTESAVLLKTGFRNTGNIHEIVSGYVSLEHWTEPKQVPGLVITDTAKYERAGVLKLETDSTCILPGETRVISSQVVDGLPKGRYRIQIVISYGSETPAVIQKEFNIETSKTEK
jgi:hypothetical protein